MFIRKRLKQALFAILCLTAAFTVFMKSPVNAKAEEVSKTIINSIEIETDVVKINNMCGPAYLISEIHGVANEVTGPKKEDHKGYYVETEIYYRNRYDMTFYRDLVSFKECSNKRELMSMETLKSWETSKDHHCTAYYLVYHVIADTEAGFYFDPKHKPAFSFKGYGGTGYFKYVDWNSTVTCSENEMWIAVELSLNTNQAPRVAGVEIKYPSANEVGVGQTIQLSAKVYAYNMDNGVVWSIQNQSSKDTVIDQNGLLTVGPDEAAHLIEVTATSKGDPTKKDNGQVFIVRTPSIYEVLLGEGAEKLSRNTNGSIYECYIEPGSSAVIESRIFEIVENDVNFIYWDNYTVTPAFQNSIPEWTPKSADTKVTLYYQIKRYFQISIGEDEPTGELFYIVQSGFDPTKYSFLKVNVGKCCKIKYDANGGAFSKNLNKNILEGKAYSVADGDNVLPPAGKVFKCWNIDGVEYKAGEGIPAVNSDLLIRAVYMDDPFVKQPQSISLGCDSAASDGMQITFRFNAPGEIQQIFQTWLVGEHHPSFEVEYYYSLTVNDNLFTISVPSDQYWKWLGKNIIEIRVNNVWYKSAVFQVQTEEGHHVYDRWYKYDSEKCTSSCSQCGKESVYQSHVWEESRIEKYPTATESGEVIYICSYCGTQKTVNFTGYFTTQPKNVYNKNDSTESNGFTVSEAMKGWSIERKTADGFNTVDITEKSYGANTHVDFTCGAAGGLLPGVYRIKVILENGYIIYSETFAVADIIDVIGVFDLDMPVAGETFDRDVTILTDPQFNDVIEKTAIRWFKQGSRFYEGLTNKAVEGRIYYCEIILTPAEGYGFKTKKDGSYAMDVFCPLSQPVTEVDGDGKLHIKIETTTEKAQEPVQDVEGLIVTSGVNEAMLRWNSVPGAVKYAVYMKNSAGTTLLNGNVTTNSYKAEGLAGGEKVGFTVRAYTDSWGNYSPVMWAMVHTPETAVVSKVVVATDMNQAVVTWSGVSGANAYALYQKNADGSTSLISNRITGTTYTVTGLADGARVGYCVRVKIGSTWYGYSSVTWVTLPAPAVPPTGVKAQGGDGCATVTWNEVPGAVRYALYQKSPSGAVTLISAEVTGTSYVVTGLTNGETVGFVLKSRTSKGWSTWSATGWTKPQSGK